MAEQMEGALKKQKEDAETRPCPTAETMGDVATRFSDVFLILAHLKRVNKPKT
jgi:hypothetical protein